jgi:hydroxyacylglutathione hydrolase
MQLIPIPAFTDNYIWMLHNGHHALVVDPGEARPVLDALQRSGVLLEAILVTHHHADHTGGVDALRAHTGCKVFGPAHEPMPEPLTRLSGGEQVHVLGLSFLVIDVPGHTAGHIAYYSEQVNDSPLLFCGDTLFSAGCGRLFEGTPAQMLQSLQSLSALPDDTLVCCTHEYTLSNLRFAVTVDPENKYLTDYTTRCQALRSDMRPTLPSTIRTERLINPFLRTREPALIAAAQSFDATAQDEVTVFAALRQWKNSFS